MAPIARPAFQLTFAGILACTGCHAALQEHAPSPATTWVAESVRRSARCGMKLVDVDNHGNPLVIDPNDVSKLVLLDAECRTTGVSSVEDYAASDACASGPSVIVSLRRAKTSRTLLPQDAHKSSAPDAVKLRALPAISPLKTLLANSDATEVIPSDGNQFSFRLKTAKGLDARTLQLMIDIADRAAKDGDMEVRMEPDAPRLVNDTITVHSHPPQIDNSEFLSDIGASNIDQWNPAAVKVAIIDGGIFPHVDLRNHMDCCNGATATTCQGWMTRGRSFSCVDGNDQHATIIAGVIGAVSAKSGARFGVAPAASLQSWQGEAKSPAKRCDRPLAAATAIRAAADHGAQVLNISLQAKEECPQLLIDALDYARSMPSNPVIVIAAGNEESTSLDRSDVHVCPSQLRRPGVITVMAVEPNGESVSSYGPVLTPIAVPIGKIGRACGTSPDSGTSPDGCPETYTRYGQSSIATAVVSGAVALLRSHPNYSRCSAAQVVAILRCKAKSVAALDGLVGQPGGMLDLHFLGVPYPDAEAPQDFCAGWSHQADNVDMTSKICDSIPKPKASPPHSPVADH